MGFLKELWRSLASLFTTPIKIRVEVGEKTVPPVPARATPPKRVEVADSAIFLPKYAKIGDRIHHTSELRKYLLIHQTDWIDWNHIVLHHSATDDGDVKEDFSAIRKYHKEHNDWLEIGYHFVIEREGGKLILRVGRPLSMRGAHAIGYNTTGIGICHVGNFDHYRPDPEMLAFSQECARILMDLCNVEKQNVIGHRETYVRRQVPVEKSCPGSRFDLELYRSGL